ncbi:raffinose/stachyose/melibiose transport system permease protein [Harryflintia acetispora]|uniref:Raffinose/stachyose/melibiose transport system permease protein n=2 Tax=Harryflintia acetispora TaxID=1849041 RepID=A0A9X8Y7L5_9FIRM|nr:raffinose/stachyose/melibiose transport system permease protein [Harryflintia acetispora]
MNFMRVKWYVPYLFVLPAFLLIVVVLYNPIVQNMYTSLFSTAAFSSQPRFVGLQNYASFFSDANLLTAFRNNIYYGITCIVFQCGLGLVLAIIMESKLIRNHSGFFRTVYFIPSVISITAAALLWKFIYQSRGGLLNTVLATLGLEQFQHAWLGEANLAIWAIILMAQWQYMGYYCMLLIVSIQKIPEDMYESASIDGANGFQKAIYITIPAIREMILVVTVIDVIGCLKVFTEVYVMTLGGPGYASHTVGTLLYQYAFIYNKMGYAAAIGTVMFVIMLLLSMLQLRISGSGKQ